MNHWASSALPSSGRPPYATYLTGFLRDEPDGDGMRLCDYYMSHREEIDSLIASNFVDIEGSSTRSDLGMADAIRVMGLPIWAWISFKPRPRPTGLAALANTRFLTQRDCDRALKSSKEAVIKASSKLPLWRVLELPANNLTDAGEDSTPSRWLQIKVSMHCDKAVITKFFSTTSKSLCIGTAASVCHSPRRIP